MSNPPPTDEVSVQIEASTAQTLMDWNVLHFTDKGWIIDLDIWNTRSEDKGWRTIDSAPNALEANKRALSRLTISPENIERVAAAIKPNLFRLYPSGKSASHERARAMARAALEAMST